MSEFHLPGEFWQARQSLGAIRCAAQSRQRSPDAVFASALAYLAASAPPGVMLPAIVGSEVGLGFASGLVANSGHGKTGSLNVAHDLLRTTLHPDVRRVMVGTGEGMAEAYYGMIPDPKDPNKTIRGRAHDRRLFFADEGSKLLAISGRNNGGAVLLQTIATAWSGSDFGEENADAAKQRPVLRGTYSFAILAGFQPHALAPMLAMAEGGVPGRFFYASAIDSSLPDSPPPWPKWSPKRMPTSKDYRRPNLIFPTVDVAASVQAEIRAADLRVQRGEAEPGPLDGHANLVRLKVAALLGLLEGRTDLTEEDWQLAGEAAATSRAVRDWAVDEARHKQADQDASNDERAGQRAVAVDEYRERKRLEAVRDRVFEMVTDKPGELTTNDIRNATTKTRRDVVPDALADLSGMDLIEEREAPGQGTPKRRWWPK